MAILQLSFSHDKSLEKKKRMMRKIFLSFSYALWMKQRELWRSNSITEESFRQGLNLEWRTKPRQKSFLQCLSKIRQM